MTHNITWDNLKRQLIRLCTMTTKQYHIVVHEGLLMEDRYCLLDSNDEEITQWHTIEEFWDNMYSMIRLLQHDQDKIRNWGAVVQ